MNRPLGVLLGFAVLVTHPAAAEDPSPANAGGFELSEIAEPRLVHPQFVRPEFVWSATLFADVNVVDPETDSNDVGDYFDQYQFTPDKNGSFPLELGVRDARFDWSDRDETPRVQVRYESPTSNLGLFGSQADEAFFNQRLDVYGRRPELALDLRYRRMRTEEQRIFPDTAGGALVFEDLSSPSERFERERTAVDGELRVRPLDFIAVDEGSLAERIAPEFSIRGGYEARDGDRQVRFLRPVSADWLGLAQPMDRSVSNVGAGVVLLPWGLTTLSLDFDHERFRWDSARTLEGDLGYAPPESSRDVRFVPDTNQSRGAIRIHSRIGDRARVAGGLQLTHVEQTGDRTPNQRSAGLLDNSVTRYSANATLDVRVADNLSFDATFKFDRRNNDIPRDTALFASDNGTQSGGFVESWRRFAGSGEFVYRMPGANTASLGVRVEDIERDIDFAEPGALYLRVVPRNSLVSQDTRMVTVFGRTALRPVRGLNMTAELGYRDAPRTGYATDLDNYVYGKLRASYVVPLPRVVVASAFVRGSQGRNRDFEMVSGTGSEPMGPRVARKFDRTDLNWGFTLTGSPREDLSLFASFFQGRDDQDHSFTVSTLQRYWQDNVPIVFSNDGTSRFEHRYSNLIVGANARLGEQTEGSLRYAFTRAEALFDDASDSSRLERIASNQRVDSDIHGIHLEVRHRLRDGLGVLIGYGLQVHDDRAPVAESTGSVVEPSDRSTYRHRVTVGVTLTQGLLATQD